MLLQKQVQRDGEAALGEPAGAVMTRRAAVGEQPCRRFALVEVFRPRGPIRDEKNDANEEQSDHHSAKPGVPADQLHTLTIFLARRYAILGVEQAPQATSARGLSLSPVASASRSMNCGSSASRSLRSGSPP